MMRHMFYRMVLCLAVAMVIALWFIQPHIRGGQVQHWWFGEVNATLLPRRQSSSVRPMGEYSIAWMTTTYTIRRMLSLEEQLFQGFETCEYRNCKITYNYTEAVHSDAVIFAGRSFSHSWSKQLKFQRPLGQVWIFFENESPKTLTGLLNFGKVVSRATWKNQFNWTMTYDSSKTDILYTCGETRQKEAIPDRNYTSIAMNKTGDVLIITSHCSTHSKREKYIAELRKYISVKTLGACGEQWTCGRKWLHDDCFLILNKYRFYLAFENSLCNEYVTEKYFDNYKYDTVLITRNGGRKGEANNVFPKGTFISTDDFNSVKDLAAHLKKLSSSVTDYAAMLKRKDRYYSVSYATMYQRAMCDVCKRLNHQEKYRQTLNETDLYRRVFDTKACRNPSDI